MIKTFSHGWDLNNKKERKEAKKFLHVFLEKDKIYSKQRLTLSFDQFSLLARKNWEEYLKHFTTNLLFFDRITKLGKLRIEVTYVPDYMKCNPKYRFETIMTGIRQHKYNSYKDIKNDFVDILNKSTEVTGEYIKNNIGLFNSFLVGILKLFAPLF